MRYSFAEIALVFQSYCQLSTQKDLIYSAQSGDYLVGLSQVLLDLSALLVSKAQLEVLDLQGNKDSLELLVQLEYQVMWDSRDNKVIKVNSQGRFCLSRIVIKIFIYICIRHSFFLVI